MNLKNFSKTVHDYLKWCFYLLLLLACFLTVYVTFSKIILRRYKDKTFKATYNFHHNNVSECQSTDIFENLRDLRIVMNDLNTDPVFNYFLCFSSLFNAMKAENYTFVKSKIYNASFNESLQKVENKDKFQLCKDESLNLHICSLKRDKEICERFASCKKNFWNGEYEITLSSKITLTLHTYRSHLKHQLGFWRHIWLEPNEFNALDTMAKREMGLLGILYGSRDLFDVPLNSFYNNGNRKRQAYYYLNFLGVTFRLPADITSYVYTDSVKL